VVLSSDDQVLRQSSIIFAQIPLQVSSLDLSDNEAADMGSSEVARQLGLNSTGAKVVVARGKSGGDADADPVRGVVPGV
jgi:hypothetical protein